MPSLKLNYKDVWLKVSQFLGLGDTPTGTDLTKVKNITLRGYRKFLMPLDMSQNPPRTYRWYFLQKTTTMSIVSRQDTYKMPMGFSALVLPFTNITPLSWNPTQKPLSYIYLQKSQTTGTGYPRYFAIQTGKYDPITGQQDEVVFWPMPVSNLTYYYTYTFTPSAPVEDEDQFAGDDYAAECILESALSVADLQENDNIGVHSKEAERLIQAAIGEDKRNYIVPNMGSMGKGKDEYIRSSTIYLDSTQVLPEI